MKNNTGIDTLPPSKDSVIGADTRFHIPSTVPTSMLTLPSSLLASPLCNCSDYLPPVPDDNYNMPLTSPHPPEELIQAVNIQEIRKDFPALLNTANGNPVIWFDNGATTHKPRQVIERITKFYSRENSNVHRGAHPMAAHATAAYEDARKTVADFIHAESPEEIIFVRGTTEGINLVTQSYAKYHVSAGEEIIVSNLEHHANIVPWQLLCKEIGAVLKVIPVDDNGDIDIDAFQQLLSSKTRLVSVAHVSNVLGTVTPVEQITQLAHQAGAVVCIDGAQSVAHLPVDVQKIGCDFYAFSGHKIYGPTGIGALFVKKAVMEEMQPYQSGGSMIKSVSFEETIFNPPPFKFEAGTGNIAGALGFASALQYLNPIRDQVIEYEQMLVSYTFRAMSSIPGLNIIGNPAERVSAFSFVVENIPSEILGRELSQQGFALRWGHHCAQPIVNRFGYESVLRIALALYNTKEEVDFFVQTLQSIIQRSVSEA